ncbi:MAG: hypothetical protein ACI9LX_001947 [Paraglaciecola sp.]
MSKYRVEIKSSRLLVIIQLLSYVLIVFSIFSWQNESIKYQILLQILVFCILTIYIFKIVFNTFCQKHSPVVFSQCGEWLETNLGEQTSWKVTDKSRVSFFLIFIHMISPLNYSQSKWCLIYRDQVSNRDFRRLCRVVIYQQQTAAKN